MKLTELFEEYKTKNNEKIDVDVREDVEEKNRGWRVDLFRANVDGQYAGYLATTYIPSSNFNKFYPNIFNWISQIQGKTILPFGKGSADWRTLSSAEKRNMILSYYLYHRYPQMSEKEIKNIPDDQVDQVVKDIEKHANKKYGSEFKNFYDYFVDKPYEDFIRVFEAGDEQRAGVREPSIGTAPKSYKRQGVALALYAEAVDHYAKRGLRMRLSTLRSREGGQAIGDYLINKGVTYRDGEFDFIDPAKMSEFVKNNLQ